MKVDQWQLVQMKRTRFDAMVKKKKKRRRTTTEWQDLIYSRPAAWSTNIQTDSLSGPSTCCTHPSKRPVAVSCWQCWQNGRGQLAGGRVQPASQGALDASRVFLGRYIVKKEAKVFTVMKRA